MAAIKKSVKKKSVPKMGNGGKIVKGFSKPVSQGLDEMRNGGKVKPKK
jgi:hypothetical protein